MPAYLPQLAFQPYIQPDTGGEPIKELSDLGTSLNSAYNTSIAQQDALDEHIAQLQATLSPVDHPLLDTIQQQTRGDLDDIKKNGNYENAQMPLRAAARRLLTNPALLTAQMNAQTRQKLDDINAQLQEQGHQIVQWKDYHNTPSVNADGSLNKLTLSGVFDKYLDPHQKMEEIFQGVNPDSYSSKVSKPERDDATGQIYQVGSSGTYRKLDSKKMQNVVANNLHNYLNTDEGMQQYKILTTKNSMNGTPLTDQQAQDKIAHDLLMVGYAHRFNDVATENSEKLTKQDGSNPDPNAGTVAVQDAAVPINQEFSSLKDALQKKDRSVGNLNAAMSTPTGGGSPYFDALDVSKNKTPQYDNTTLQKSPLYQSLSKLYSQQLGTKDQDRINPLVSKYLSSLENRSTAPTLHATSDPKRIKAENDVIQNGIVKQLSLYSLKTGKKYNSGEADNFKSDYPNIKEKDFNEAKLVGIYDQDHPFADITGDDNFTTARKINIGGEDFVAGGMEQDKRAPSYVSNYLGNKITQAHRTGQPINFTNGKDNMKVFDKGDGTYLIQGKDSKGNDLPIVPLTLEQAKTFLGTSGFISQK